MNQPPNSENTAEDRLEQGIQVAEGQAVTQEQISDSYKMGTVDDRERKE